MRNGRIAVATHDENEDEKFDSLIPPTFSRNATYRIIA